MRMLKVSAIYKSRRQININEIRETKTGAKIPKAVLSSSHDKVQSTLGVQSPISDHYQPWFITISKSSHLVSCNS